MRRVPSTCVSGRVKSCHARVAFGAAHVLFRFSWMVLLSFVWFHVDLRQSHLDETTLNSCG